MSNLFRIQNKIIARRLNHLSTPESIPPRDWNRPQYLEVRREWM